MLKEEGCFSKQYFGVFRVVPLERKMAKKKKAQTLNSKMKTLVDYTKHYVVGIAALILEKVYR